MSSSKDRQSNQYTGMLTIIILCFQF
ncbi:hypothetical protein MAR_032122, partial [Mya arenaria]